METGTCFGVEMIEFEEFDLVLSGSSRNGMLKMQCRFVRLKRTFRDLFVS